MEHYKKAIYKSYVTLHNQQLFGTPTLDKYRTQFPVFDFYLESFLPADKNARILDIGCGDGNLVYWMQQKGYTQVYGVDVSEEQIETGQKLGIPNLHCQPVESFLQESPGSFDLMIARDVFEHFTRQDFFDTLCKVHGHLSPSGRLLLQLPNGEGLNARAIFYGDITHEWAYTHQSLSQLGRAAGFSAIQTQPVRPYSRGLKGGIRAALWQLKEAQLRFWKWIETGRRDGIFTSNLIAEMRR